MNATTNTERPEIQNPEIRAEVQRRVEALDGTHQALSIKMTFEAWDTQRDRLGALVATVVNSLAKNEDYFTELQLLEIAEDILGCTREVNRLKKALGVEE